MTMTCSMTQAEAAAALRRCPTCSRWSCYETCDHCWVDSHRCPTTVEQALATLQRAMEIGREAEALAAQLKLVRVR